MTANFWSRKQHRRGFRISDPPKKEFRISDPPKNTTNTTKGSEFLIPQRTLQRVQNFWSPKNATKGSEFLIPQRTLQRVQNFWSPKEHYKGFRISDPPKNTTKGLEFLIPKEHRKWFSISDPQKNTGGDLEFLISFKASVTSNVATLGFRSCCLPERCLIKYLIYFLDNNIEWEISYNTIIFLKDPIHSDCTERVIKNKFLHSSLHSDY